MRHFARERINAAIHGCTRALFFRTILVLDDFHKLRTPTHNNTPISGWVIRLHRQYTQLRRSFAHFPNSFSSNERHIARQHNDLSLRVNMGQTTRYGVARAKRRVLDHIFNIKVCVFSNRRLNNIFVFADNNQNARTRWQ